LTELDVSNLANLTGLYCAGNPLTTLSLSAVPPTSIDVDPVVLLVPDKTNYADLSQFPAGTHALLKSEYSMIAGVDGDVLILASDIAGTNRHQWQRMGTSGWENATGATAAIYETDVASAADFYRLKFYFADDAAGTYEFYTAPLDIALAVSVPNLAGQLGLTDKPDSGNVTAVPAGTTDVSWTFTIDAMYDLSTVKLGPLPSGVTLSLTRDALTGTVTVSGTVTHRDDPYTIDLKLSAKRRGATGVTDSWYESSTYPIHIAPSDPDRPPTLPPTTKVTIEFDSNGQIVSLMVTTSDGSPVPEDVWFRIWLLIQPGNRSVADGDDSSILADDEDEYYGPFLVKSVKDENGNTKLDIDVDNLITPSGEKGVIPAGSYVVQFADDSLAYVGTTEAIELPATKTSVAPPDTTPDTTPDGGDSGGGGGCDAGMTALFPALFFMFCAMSRKKRG
jgi:hypothetical protein